MSAGPGATGAARFAWRDVVEGARFQLLEAVRTRRAVVLVVLFLVGGGLSSWGFARGLLALIAAVFRLSALTFFAVAAFTMTGFRAGENLLAAIRFWPWLVVDVLPYLGLALGVSMIGSGPQSARALALLSVLVLASLH